MPSEMTFRLAFGSWGNGLRAAGFEPAKWIPTKNGVTRKGTRNKSRKEVEDGGYLALFEPTHPLANKKGYVRVHRMVAYNAGLLADPTMEVHHINGNKKDNRLDNLQVLAKPAHTSLTHKGLKRPQHGSKPCSVVGCGILTASRYGLCTKHYKAAWSKAKYYENPELLDTLESK